jgi:hypothetical protein
MTKQWTLTWGDHVWTEDDLTAGDISLAQAVTGDGWNSHEVTRGPLHAANLLAILIARTEGRPLQAVSVELAAVPATVLAGAIGVKDA